MSKIIKAPFINFAKDKKSIEIPAFSEIQAKNNFDFQSDNIDIENPNGQDFEDVEPLAEVNETKLSKEDIISEAQNEASEIIENAQAEAEQIKIAAQEEIEQIKQSIFEQSKQEGYQVGYDEAMLQIENIKKEAEKIRNDAIAEKEAVINQTEPELVELTINIVHKILGDSIKINPQVVLALIRQGLSKASSSGDLFIHVSQEDYENVINNKEEILLFTDGNTNLEIIKDFSLNKGDCIIETPFGNIDCSLEQQFESLKQSIYYILENR